MLSLRPFRALSLAVASLAIAAVAAGGAPISGKSFVVKLTRDGLADGVDTLVFEEKAVLSMIPDALFIGTVKIKGKPDGDSYVFEGKAKCVQGGKGKLSGSIRGSSIAGSLACTGDESYTMEFQGLQIARAVAGSSTEEPRYKVTGASSVPQSAAGGASPAAMPSAPPAAAVPASAPVAVSVAAPPPVDGAPAPAPAEAPSATPSPDRSIAPPVGSPAEEVGATVPAGAAIESAAPSAPAATESSMPGGVSEGASQPVSTDADQRGYVAGKVDPAVPVE